MTLSPIAFWLGSWPVRWYGLAYIFSALAFWVYGRFCVSRNRFPPLKTADIDGFLNWGLLGVVVGGRLGHVFLYQPELLSCPLEILKLWQPGMSFHGGLLAVFIAIFFYSRVHAISLLALMDCCAACAPLGLFLGRIANFVNQELYGTPTRSVFGVIFPMVDTIPRHPSQLYEAALEGVVLFILLAIMTWWTKGTRRPGVITGVFLVTYGLMRWICELFREPIEVFFSLGLTMGQFYSLPLIAAGLFVLFKQITLPRKK